jgi:hypothetical protein
MRNAMREMLNLDGMMREVDRNRNGDIVIDKRMDGAGYGLSQTLGLKHDEDISTSRQIHSPRWRDHRLLLKLLARAIMRVMGGRVVTIVVMILRSFMVSVPSTSARAKPSGK